MVWSLFNHADKQAKDITLRKLYMLKSDDEDNILNVYFGIYLTRQNVKVGECDLRIGMNEELYYAGNIGYRIYDGYRGHHYARTACAQLMDIAKEKYHMKQLIITCTPSNIASKKTLEHLNGQLLETVDVPTWHWLYERGEVIKDVYLFNL